MAATLLAQARSAQEVLTERRAGHDRARDELQAILDRLRPKCRHTRVIEIEPGPDWRLREGLRVCLDCGIEEKCNTIIFAIMRRPPMRYRRQDWEAFQALIPFPDHREFWEMCHWGWREQFHPVPAKILVKQTHLRPEHVGELCPSCKGNPHYHDQGGDGHGGLNGGRWVTCSVCGGSGLARTTRAV